MTNGEVDARAFGSLEAEVANLRTTVNSLESKVQLLLDLANRSKGALWVGMIMAATFGAIVEWSIRFIFERRL